MAFPLRALRLCPALPRCITQLSSVLGPPKPVSPVREPPRHASDLAADSIRRLIRPGEHLRVVHV